jgi:hypothetical protein
MFKVSMHSVLILIAVAMLPSIAFPQERKSGCAVNAKVGTLGIGADLSCSLVPRILNLRVGASFFPYTANFTEKDIDYTGKLRLGGVPIALDVFPFKNWFRLGGGLIVNLNEVKGTAVANQGTLTIGDHRYSVQDVGQFQGQAKFNRAAPYFGIGFNNPVKRKGHWGFFADLGGMYHGRPLITLTASKTSTQLQADLIKEVQKVNEDLKKFTIFPVIQFGLSYCF